MKVFIGGFGKPGPTVVEYDNQFTALARQNKGGHVLVEQPEEAEILLFIWNTDSTRDWTRAERALVRARAEDCFAFNPSDLPGFLLSGVYANLSRSEGNLRRHRGYCFPFVNPFAEEVYRERLKPDLFFSFAGGSTSRVRKKLFRTDFHRSDVLIQDTSYHQEWNPHQPEWGENKRRFMEILARSEFVLCPRGAGVNAGRIFESMQVARPVVIVSDRLILPRGPAWERFSVSIPEAEIGRIPEILEPLRGRAEEMGQIARAEWERWFAPEVWFDRIIEQIVEIKKTRRVPERLYQLGWPIRDLQWRTQIFVRQAVKNAILRALKIFRVRLANLNRH